MFARIRGCGRVWNRCVGGVGRRWLGTRGRQAREKIRQEFSVRYLGKRVPVLYTDCASTSVEWVDRVLGAAVGVGPKKGEEKKVVVGFDCEWAPQWRKGKPNPVSLVQMAVERVDGVSEVLCANVGLMQELGGVGELLQRKGVVLTGIGVEEDVKKVCGDWGAEWKGEVQDVRDLLATYGIQVHRPGLQGLSTTLLGAPKWKSRGTSRSDWGSPMLTNSQLTYAALDALYSLKLNTFLTTAIATSTSSPPAFPNFPTPHFPASLTFLSRPSPKEELSSFLLALPSCKGGRKEVQRVSAQMAWPHFSGYPKALVRKLRTAMGGARKE